MRENADQNNPEYEQFACSNIISSKFFYLLNKQQQIHYRKKKSYNK